MQNEFLSNAAGNARDISEIFEQDSRRYSRALTEEQEADA